MLLPVYIIIYCITYFYVGNVPIIYVICTYIVCICIYYVVLVNGKRHKMMNLTIRLKTLNETISFVKS